MTIPEAPYGRVKFKIRNRQSNNVCLRLLNVGNMHAGKSTLMLQFVNNLYDFVCPIEGVSETLVLLIR